MFGFLLALLILNGLFLMTVVLLQAGKGGGLAAMGGAGTETLIGGRQAATILTKATWVAGSLFLVLALVLSILSTRRAQPESILRQELQQTAPAPQPLLPGAQPAQPSGQGGAGGQGGATMPGGAGTQAPTTPQR